MYVGIYRLSHINYAVMHVASKLCISENNLMSATPPHTTTVNYDTQ